MTAPVSIPAQQSEPRGRLWWLPADGCGNGIDDDAWAPVLEIACQAVPVLLAVLRDAGVPAYAAPVRPVSARLKDGPPEESGCYRLYVGTSAYGEAETALLAAMPLLTREAACDAGPTWR